MHQQFRPSHLLAIAEPPFVLNIPRCEKWISSDVDPSHRQPRSDSPKCNHSLCPREWSSALWRCESLKWDYSQQRLGGLRAPESTLRIIARS
jgi:hypothetical protein